MAPFADASIQRQFRNRLQVGLSVNSPGRTAEQEQITENPIFQALRYASRSIRSKKAPFAEDFHLPPVRNFSA
jgi:hypothetical protein